MPRTILFSIVGLIGAAVGATECAGQQSVRFRNDTQKSADISLQAADKDTATKLTCAPGKTVTFNLISPGPFDVTIDRGDEHFSRYGVDLQAVRRQMTGDTLSITTIADVEESAVAAGEPATIKTIAGALALSTQLRDGRTIQFLLQRAWAEPAAAPSLPNPPEFGTRSYGPRSWPAPAAAPSVPYSTGFGTPSVNPPEFKPGGGPKP